MNHQLTGRWAVSALGLLMVAAPRASAQMGGAQMESASAPSAAAGGNTPLAFAQLSTPGAIPARLQLKALGKGWQRITLENDRDDAYSIYLSRFGGSAFQDTMTNAGIGVYYTKGQSVVMGSETFLVAYRLDNGMTSDDIQSLFRNMDGHSNDGPQQGPRKFAGDTLLRLSLLNLRAVGNLRDVRAFDARRDIMGPRDITDASDANLRQLGVLLARLAQNSGYSVTRLPLNDAATLRRAFNNYFHSGANLFVHPQTKEPYRTNAALAQMPLRLISNRAQIVAIYEARPGSDGKYGTVFLDGHTARVPQAQWARVRAVMPHQPGAAEVRRLSENNLRQLYAQVVRYARFRQGKLPQMGDAFALRRNLANFSGAWNAPYFTHPVTGASYRPNALLNGKVLKQVAYPARVIALYEASPGSDGKRAAVFLDGHLERIAAANWNKARLVVPVVVKTTGKKAGVKKV